MKTLQFIPVTMFFAGLLLIYCGFKDVTMVDVLRQNIGSLDEPISNDWQQNSNPLYNGIQGGTPYRSGSPGLFTS